MFIIGFLILKRIRDIQYDTDKTKKVEIAQEKIEMISVLINICGKFKIRFGQTFVVAQIEKVSGIDARLTQLEACHVQKVADIERDLQTMDTLMLVGSDEQQAFIHQIFFVQRRTGKNDGQCFFFRHG